MPMVFKELITEQDSHSNAVLGNGPATATVAYHEELSTVPLQALQTRGSGVKVLTNVGLHCRNSHKHEIACCQMPFSNAQCWLLLLKFS